MDVEGLQGRLRTKEDDLLKAVEKMKGLSLDHEGIQAAQRETDKEIQDINLLYNRVLLEKEEFFDASKKKGAII